MNGFQSVIKVFAICLAVFIIVNIFGWTIFGLSFLVHIGNNDYDEFSEITESAEMEMETTEDFSETYKNVDRIKIEIVSAKLNIKEGNELKLEVKGMKSRVNSKIHNGTLKIEEHKKWFWKDGFSGYITLYIPKDINLKELDIDSGAGKIEINNIYSNIFELEHGAGAITISNSQFDKTEINGGAGEFKVLSSRLNDLDLAAGVGRAVIEAEITGRSKIECGIGEIDIKLIGSEEDYKIIAENGIGSLKIKGNSVSNEKTYGDGRNVIEVEGGIGSIKVDFEN